MGKICTVCKTEKPLDQFGIRRRNPDGRNYTCLLCDAARARRRRQDPTVAAHRRAWEKIRRDAKRTEINAARRQESKELREAAIGAYGGACDCCGEDRLEFLTIAHVNGDGKAHRADGFRGRKLYQFMIQNPGDPRLAIACANCHYARDFYGTCPHQAAIS